MKALDDHSAESARHALMSRPRDRCARRVLPFGWRASPAVGSGRRGHAARAALAVVAIVVASAASRAEDEVTEVVAAPVVLFDGGAPPGYGLPDLLPLGSWQGEHEFATVPLAAEVRRMFEEEVGALDGRLQDEEETRISVQGPPAAADLLRTRLAELSRALDGRVVVEVAVARLPADAPSGLPRDALLDLVRSNLAEMLFGERLTVRRGETVRRESLERATLASAFEVDVAQEASVAPPVTAELTTGRRLAVHARALPSGRVALNVAVQVSRVEGPVRRESTSGGDVDLPAVRIAALSAPFLLAEGATDEARVPDPFGDGTLLVRLTLVHGPAAAEGPWRLADLHVAAGDDMVAQLFAQPGWLDETYSEEVPDDEYRTARIQACRARLERAGIAAEDLTQGLVALKGGPLDAFEQVFEEEFRTAAVSRRALRMDPAKLAAAPWFDPLEGRVTADVPADAGKAAAPLRLPLRGDTPTLLLVGTWRRLVSDVDVKVAQAAVGVEPQVASHFEGEAILARLVPTGPGRPPSVEVAHRTCAVLARAQRPAVLRSQVYGRDANDDGTKVDTLTAATSRSRIAVVRAPVTTVRREGAADVLEVWTLE